MKRFVLLTLCAAAVAASCSVATKHREDAPSTAIGNAPHAALADEGAATYYQNIKPLIEARCEGCHLPGGVAFSLKTEADVMAKKTNIALAVAAKRMPVWLAAPGHQDYRDDPTLNAAELAQFAQWKAGGYQIGDPNGPVDQVRQVTLKDLDADVTIPLLPAGDSYLPNQAAADDYHCFVLEWPLAADKKYMTGFQAIPGNTSVVHHLVAYRIRDEVVPMLRRLDELEPGAGYQCFGGALPDSLGDPAIRAQMNREFPGVLQRNSRAGMWLGHWAPGMRGAEFPEGTGVPMLPGGLVVVQVHFYTKTAPNTADSGSEVRFKLVDQVPKPAFIIPLSNGDWFDGQSTRSLVVPPHGETTVSYSETLEDIAYFGRRELGLTGPYKGLELQTVNLHMHSFGKSAITTLTGPQGSKETLLEIPRWNLSWQRDFTFVQSKVFAKDDLAGYRLGLDCTFKNDTNQEVYGGLGSGDEMCMNFSLIAFDLGQTAP